MTAGSASVTMSRMRGMVAAIGVLLSACGTISTLDGTSPTPTVGTSRLTAVPTSASPRRLPGNVVRVSVNGVDATGTAVRDPAVGPVTVILTFPFAVDRASVERWGMSGQPTKTWLDDHTLRLIFAETEPHINFKIAETLSASGDAVIDFFVVDVTFPAARLVSVYAVPDLLAAVNRAPRASGSWRVRADDGIALAPDASRVLIYDGLGAPSGQVPTFVELDTKKTTVLTQPPASDGWFSFADWMADGRLVMVGRGVWVGDANASDMKRIADTQSAASGAVWIVLPDPNEKRIALWGYNTDGHIAIVDLGTGAVQKITGPFRRCVADGAVSFAWSADGRFLAGTDCDSEEGPAKARVRIVDVAADRTVRTIEGGTYGINGLPNGNFILVRESGEQGEGMRLLGLVLGFDGQEHGRYLGAGWQMSPDRRYLLQQEMGPAGCCGFTLFDLVAGTSVGFVVPYGGQSDGPRPTPHWMRDGRLAFF